MARSPLRSKVCRLRPSLPLMLLAESRAQLQMQFLGQLGSYIASPLSSVEESLGMVEFLEGTR